MCGGASQHTFLLLASSSRLIRNVCFFLSFFFVSLRFLPASSTQDAVAIGDDLDRDKRKVPDPKYETKNAILGFVFGVSTCIS